jgi:hypothetical protein
MLLGKRKERDEGNEDISAYDGDDMEESDDEESLTHAPNQALPIANLPAGFSGVPQDGMEYLFTVRWAYITLSVPDTCFDLCSSRTDTDCLPNFYRRDARMLPRFTRVLNPGGSSIEPRKPVILPMQTEVHEAFPTDEWRQSFLEHFRNCRSVRPSDCTFFFR